MIGEETRTVHAETDNIEVVRYNRAGKWYLESKGDHPRQMVNIQQAASFAVTGAAKVYFGMPGGSAFDRAVRAKRGGR